MILAEDIGIITVEGQMPLIKAGETLPTSFVDYFSTAIDYQENVELTLYAGGVYGNSRDLGKFRIDNLELVPKGIPRILVKLDIDQAGHAEITAIYRADSSAMEDKATKHLSLGLVEVR